MPTEYTGMLSRDGTRVLADRGELCARCGALWPRGTKHDCPKAIPTKRSSRVERLVSAVFQPYDVDPTRGRCPLCGEDGTGRDEVTAFVEDLLSRRPAP